MGNAEWEGQKRPGKIALKKPEKKGISKKKNETESTKIHRRKRVMGEEEGRRGGAVGCAFCTGLELDSSTETEMGKAGTAAVMPSQSGFGRSCFLYRSNDRPRGWSIRIWTAYRASAGDIPRFSGSTLHRCRYGTTETCNSGVKTQLRQRGTRARDRYIVAVKTCKWTRINGRTNGLGRGGPGSAITASVKVV